MNNHFLRGITLFLTQKCNFNCKYCFEASKKARSTTPEIGRSAIDFLFNNYDKTLPYVSFTFFGGEPLIEKDLMYEIVSYGEYESSKKEIPILFNIVTNGSLIDDKLKQTVKDKNFAVLLSWDGKKETQNENRQYYGNDNIAELLHKHSIFFSNNILNYAVRMTVTPTTVSDLYSNVKYILDTGVTDLGFVPVYEQAWSNDSIDIFSTECKKIVKHFLNQFDQGKILHIQPLLDFARTSVGKNKKINHFFMHKCHANDFAVDIDGNLYPCHRFVAFNKENDFKFGNVMCGDFNIDKLKLYNRERAELFSSYPACAGCPALNYELYNNIKQPAPIFKQFAKAYSDSIKEILERKDRSSVIEIIG